MRFSQQLSFFVWPFFCEGSFNRTNPNHYCPNQRGIHVNFTVKAPSGGEYDVDVQKVKEKYRRWRIPMFFSVPCFLGALFFWIAMTYVSASSVSWWENLKYDVSWVFFTWQGWVALFLFSSMVLAVRYWLWGVHHFQCPFPCNAEIRIDEPWDCPYCVGKKTTIVDCPPLFHTFFDTCRKRRHKPESYQCPTCVEEGRPGIFELIPNGRTDKPAKKANVSPLQVVQLPPPPPPPVQGQVMPRNRNFF